MIKISQCMIVKNEEKNIRTALSWGKGVVDEQIVVDTGSNDRTVEIAREMGAKVYHFEWINDFSAAKNYAIAKCTGDWICFLDADEYFDEKDAKALRRILEQVGSLYTIADGKKQKYNVIKSPLVNIDTSGRAVNVTEQVRIFRNLPYIRYQGIIHERLKTGKGRSLVVYELKGQLKIFHTGYAWSDDKPMAAKGERNLELIQKAIQTRPDNAMLYFYASESLALLGRFEEAAEYAGEAVRNKDCSLDSDKLREVYQSYLYTLANCQIKNGGSWADTAASVYKRAVELYPAHPDYDIAMGVIYYNNKNYERAAEHLENALSKGEATKVENGSKILNETPKILGILTDSYYKTGRRDMAVRYAVLLLRTDKYRQDVLEIILKMLDEDEKTSNADIFNFLCKIYDFGNTKDITLILAAVKAGNLAGLAKTIAENLTDSKGTG